MKTTGDIERERDFWRGRYEVQHRTVHRLEDRIAELAAALADTERERDTEREGHRIAAERTAASREAWQAAEARVAELEAALECLLDAPQYDDWYTLPPWDRREIERARQGAAAALAAADPKETADG